jgi:hypothetical protein
VAVEGFARRRAVLVLGGFVGIVGALATLEWAFRLAGQ